MRFVGSITEQNIVKYLDDIHQDYPSSQGFVQNRFSQLPAKRTWYLGYLDLVSEIGTIVNPHNHSNQEGNALTLSTGEETLREAFKNFDDKSKEFGGHECLERIAAIKSVVSQDPSFLAKRPLVIEQISSAPLILKHFDGYHRIFAYLSLGLDQSILCYISCPKP